MNSNEICGAQDSGYTCDMHPNHGGTYHAAYGWHGRINHEWPNTGKPGMPNKNITKPSTLPRGLHDKERLWDIVRCLRVEAHAQELIDDEEYATLAADGRSRARLELDDERRGVIDELSKYKGAVCKGSLALGTGCMNCERCVAGADVLPDGCRFYNSKE